MWREIIRKLGMMSLELGFDPRRFLNIRFFPKWFAHLVQWLLRGGRVSSIEFVLNDYSDFAGVAKGHYFHQDLIVAQSIFETTPDLHIDIGSRIDGLVAHLATFRPVEVYDLRPISHTAHPNIIFKQADIFDLELTSVTDSLSCLHALEHFGLGRYGDPIHPSGHIIGVRKMIRMVSKGGHLYLSFPIGSKDRVAFNAHRVFDPRSILTWPDVEENLDLQVFHYVDDNGDLHKNVDLSGESFNLNYGCGIYHFIKV